MKHEGRGNERKSKKSTRKNAGMESSIDQERESARVLLQMRGVALDGASDLHHGDDAAASQQLIVESSPHHNEVHRLKDTDTMTRDSLKNRNHKEREKRNVRKKPRGDPFAFPSSDERDHSDARRSYLPSTPPRQTAQSTPSPYRPRISQSNHALDDIPTDDEDVTQFMEEFTTNGEGIVQRSLDDDIHGFSRQPPDTAECAQSPVHSTFQLPAGKPKRRKRSTASTSEPLTDVQLPLQDEGQHALDFEVDFEALDEFFRDVLDSADTFSVPEANDVPIDPELHSMSQLPPSVDLSQLDDRFERLSQKPKRKVKTGGLSQPKKRKRVEKVRDSNFTETRYSTSYGFDHDHTNMQDQVLPGFEDSQRQTSPELGSPFMESLAFQGLEYMSDKAQPMATQRKNKGGALNPQAKQLNSKNGEDTEHSRREKFGKGGPFTDAEATKLDAFRDAYCEANDMTTTQFNSRIQSTMRGNAEILALFNEIQDVLPYRPRMSIQRFCRRRYHNFTACGTWTSDDDEMLRKTVAEKGKQWKIIGNLIDRRAEDCRDRYRNYILNAENRNHEAWTPEEVRRLCSAVMESMKAMKDARRQERTESFGDSAALTDSDSDLEVEDMKAINWQVISDRMEGQRSRLQCSAKWRQLEKQEKDDVAQSILDQRGLEGRRLYPTKNPWRMKNAAKNAAKMKAGDKYVLVQAVLDCGVPAEGNIPWKALGDKDLRATWNSTAKKAAWSRMKQDVPNSQSMNYCDVASHLLTKIEHECAESLEERWDSKLHGDMSARKPRNLKRSKGQKADRGEMTTNSEEKERKARKSYKEWQPKSNELVQDSDDGDEDRGVPSTHEAECHTRFDAPGRSEDAQMYSDRNGDRAPNASEIQKGLTTKVIAGDGDASLFLNGSINGNDDGDDDREMAEPGVSPRLARRLRQAIRDASA